jgi:phenylpropionate dioxygenase-like ring-hydroxylating dioxygenase large terminal subunit
MYLRNGWYCAGWAAELGAAPIGRRMLGEPVMVYRAESGEPVALEGRCPHRFAPLHLGTVAQDRVACPYHGLVFDRTGACVFNPHGDIPREAKLRTYPVTERDGVIWVWMGEPAKADPELIIDSGFVVDPGYATVLGYLNVSAHYQLVIDNLLDLTHPAILHKGGLSSEEYMGEAMQHRFRQDGDTIHSDYTFADVNASPGLAPLWGQRKADVRAFMTLHPPTNLVLDFRMNEVGGPIDQGVFLPTLHLLVPENQERTHYFYAMGRNVEVDNEELSAITAKMARHAFESEDEPMIRACQEMMGTTDLFGLKPVLLKTDVAAVRARLLLDKLIAREAAEAGGALPPVTQDAAA